MTQKMPVMQAVMAAAKQQHQQHIADMQSHLQEATEATQHAQASEAEAKFTAESLGKAVKANLAASTAAAKQTEDALQLLKDTVAAAARDHAATTQQNMESLRGFVLSTVHSAVCQAAPGWQDWSGTAREVRGLLEGVSNEIRISMQTASRSLEERLRHVETVIANGNQTERACASPGQLGQIQVSVRPSLLHLQLKAVAALPHQEPFKQYNTAAAYDSEILLSFHSSFPQQVWVLSFMTNTMYLPCL